MENIALQSMEQRRMGSCKIIINANHEIDRVTKFSKNCSSDPIFVIRIIK